MDDRLMTARQLAQYLSVNERTVLKLVSEGALPGVKVGSQWRFRKAMVDTWLDDQLLGVTPRYVEGPSRAGAVGDAAPVLDLASCFLPEHAVPELASVTKTGAIEELATWAHRLGLVRDRTWFVGALIERENVLPGAIGHGVAFLHTLRRHPEQIVRPFLLVGRSRRGIDFDALDAAPTHFVCVLGLRFDAPALPWLGPLSHALAADTVQRTLLAAPDSRAMHAAILEAAGPVTATATATRTATATATRTATARRNRRPPRTKRRDR